jgi:hypothetical protein
MRSIMGILSSGIAFDHPPKPIAENPVPSDSTVYPSRSGTRGSSSTTTPSIVSSRIPTGSWAYQAAISQRVKILEQFLAPSCTPMNLDIFLVRSAILRALQDTTCSSQDAVDFLMATCWQTVYTPYSLRLRSARTSQGSKSALLGIFKMTSKEWLINYFLE